MSPDSDEPHVYHTARRGSQAFWVDRAPGYLVPGRLREGARGEL